MITAGRVRGRVLVLVGVIAIGAIVQTTLSDGNTIFRSHITACIGSCHPPHPTARIAVRLLTCRRQVCHAFTRATNVYVYQGRKQISVRDTENGRQHFTVYPGTYTVDAVDPAGRPNSHGVYTAHVGRKDVHAAANGTTFMYVRVHRWARKGLKYFTQAWWP